MFDRKDHWRLLATNPALLRASGWPFRRQILLFICVALCLLFLLHWSFIGWLESEVQVSNARYQDLQQHHQQTEAALVEIKEENLVSKRESSDLRPVKKFKLSVRPPQMIDNLTTAVKANGLTLIDIRPGRWQEESFYRTMPIRLEAQGHYSATRLFFASLAELEEVVSIEDFDLRPLENGGRNLNLKAVIRIHGSFEI